MDFNVPFGSCFLGCGTVSEARPIGMLELPMAPLGPHQSPAILNQASDYISTRHF